jgi:hypothetical protein
MQKKQIWGKNMQNFRVFFCEKKQKLCKIGLLFALGCEITKVKRSEMGAPYLHLLGTSYKYDLRQYKSKTPALAPMMYRWDKMTFELNAVGSGSGFGLASKWKVRYGSETQHGQDPQHWLPIQIVEELPKSYIISTSWKYIGFSYGVHDVVS